MTAPLAAHILRALTVEYSVIADARRTLRFTELSAAVVRVANAFDELGVATQDCLDFQCDNTLPSAVILLALLARGQHFVLSRPPEPSAAQGGQAAVRPTFCRYRLHIPSTEAADRAGGPLGIAVLGCAASLLVDQDWRANLPAAPAALFLPTSGTTGRAKLVRHRQSLLWPAARNCADRLGLTRNDRVAIPVPIAHMYGLGAAFLPSLLSGASIDLQANANPLRYFARERRFDPTVAFQTPSFDDSIIRLRRVPRRYRLTVLAGDRVTADLFDRHEAMCGPVLNLYGSTELGATALGQVADAAELRRACVGRLLPGVSVWRDPGEPHDATGPAVPEPLCFRHEFGFDGYADGNGDGIAEADGTRASGRRFRSSDVGRLVDGYLEVSGRVDDLVNRDGLLVACADVAGAIGEITGVSEAVVLAGDTARRGRALIAFCVADPDSRWDAATLRQACRDVLPTRCIPDQILLIPRMPLLASGKVDRQALRHHHDLAGS